MARIDSLETLLVDQLKDLYDAEKSLVKALPKIAKLATNDELTTALNDHLTETTEHVARLEQAFEALGVPARAKTCAGMRGILEEAQEHASAEYDDDGLRDAAIIGGAQRVEHYEIAAYGTAVAHARLLGHDDVVALLDASLAEEKTADQHLTEIAESVVNLDAADDSEIEDTPSASMAENGRAQHAKSRNR